MMAAPSSGGAASRHPGIEPGSRAAWYDTWRSFDVDPQVAEAVVWPELERYERLQDLMETAANYGSYIATGAGPDFSIGRFQMKPSFVEALEKAWMGSGLARPYELWFDTDDNATARRIRISRLQKEEWQAIYLGVFLRLLYYTYGSRDKRGEWTQDGLETLPVEEQVRLAATAYNHGTLWRSPGTGSLDRIRAVTAEEKFPLPNLFRTRMRYYSYGDLAARYYAQAFQ